MRLIKARLLVNAITSDQYLLVNANNSEFNDVGGHQYRFSTYNISYPMGQRHGTNIDIGKRTFRIAVAVGGLAVVFLFGMQLYIMCRSLLLQFIIGILIVFLESYFGSCPKFLIVSFCRKLQFCNGCKTFPRLLFMCSCVVLINLASMISVTFLEGMFSIIFENAGI